MKMKTVQRNMGVKQKEETLDLEFTLHLGGIGCV